MVEADPNPSKGHLLAPTEAAHLITTHEPRQEPPDIYLNEHLMDLQFSPCCNMLALSQVTGHVRVYAYGESHMTQVLDLTQHAESVRSIAFSPHGNILYCASKDKSFSVVSNGRVEGQLEGAHAESINKIAHLEDEVLIATGDDDGAVKIWDLRMAA